MIPCVWPTCRLSAPPMAPGWAWFFDTDPTPHLPNRPGYTGELCGHCPDHTPPWHKVTGQLALFPVARRAPEVRA